MRLDGGNYSVLAPRLKALPRQGPTLRWAAPGDDVCFGLEEGLRTQHSAHVLTQTKFKCRELFMSEGSLQRKPALSKWASKTPYGRCLNDAAITLWTQRPAEEAPQCL